MIYFLDKKKTPHKKSGINTETSIPKILVELNKHNTLSLDTETTGLNPLEDKIIMIQFGTPSMNQYVIDVRDIDITVFKGIIENKKILKIGQNLKFDYNMLKQYGILIDNIYDTMLADKVIHNGKYTIKQAIKDKRFSMKGIYFHYFDTQIDKETRYQFTKTKDETFTWQQIEYGANDVKYPFEIKRKQEELIEKYELQECVNLENEASLALGDIEYNGFKLDKEKWLKIFEEYKDKSQETVKKLDSLLLAQAPEKINKYKRICYQQDLFDFTFENHRDSTVNWNSDKQVYEVLSGVFGVRPVNKEGKASSGALAIKFLEENHEITDLILQYREEEKVVTSFGKEFIHKYLNADGRIRTSFNQIVDTGRMSSRKPNLQQIPTNEKFRSAFIAPEGKVIITTDYDNQEGRIMANKAKDKTYIDFFNSRGGDIHSFIATKMFSAAFDREFIVTRTNKNKEYRQRGKVINFFISFGGSAYVLSKILRLSQEETQGLIDAFFKGFPALEKMFNESKSFALKHGFIRTNSITNRIRWLPAWRRYIALRGKSHYGFSRKEYSELSRLKGFIERRGMNTPIQGTAGDMTKKALILIRQDLIKIGILPFKDAKAKLVNVVHDECSIETDELIAMDIAKLQKKAMEKAGGIFIKELKMTANPVIEKYWIH